MDGKLLFKKSCVSINRDFDRLFSFTIAICPLAKGERIRQCAPYSKVSEKRYIIRYYPDEDIYFVWKVRKKINNYSLNIPEDFEVKDGEIIKIEKDIDVTRKKKESVIIFKSDCIKRFLGEYIIGKE